MKICLDNIVFSLQNAGGISTYWGEICRRTMNSNLDVSFIDKKSQNIVRSKLEIPRNQIFRSFTKINLVDRFYTLQLKSINENFIFHSSYNRVTSNPKAKQVCTIHDFTHDKFYRGLRKIIHSSQKSKAIKLCDQIITVSENTKKDLLNYFPSIDPSKVHVIYHGVSEVFAPLTKADSTEMPYLLYVGSREPYKNFDFILNALNRLKEFKLFIVGHPLNSRELHTINKLISGRWVLHQNVNDLKLNELYNNAYALLYPSSYEGFGLPLLEAMKAGTPFIALNKSSIPEVAGDAGVLIEELDIDAFNFAILSIESNRSLLISRGIKQSDQFSWDKCFSKTLEVYNLMS